MIKAILRVEKTKGIYSKKCRTKLVSENISRICNKYVSNNYAPYGVSFEIKLYSKEIENGRFVRYTKPFILRVEANKYCFKKLKNEYTTYFSIDGQDYEILIQFNDNELSYILLSEVEGEDFGENWDNTYMKKINKL